MRVPAFPFSPQFITGRARARAFTPIQLSLQLSGVLSPHQFIFPPSIQYGRLPYSTATSFPRLPSFPALRASSLIKVAVVVRPTPSKHSTEAWHRDCSHCGEVVPCSSGCLPGFSSLLGRVFRQLKCHDQRSLWAPHLTHQEALPPPCSLAQSAKQLGTSAC